MIMNKIEFNIPSSLEKRTSFIIGHLCPMINKTVSLITISPQEYSISMEFPNYITMKYDSVYGINSNILLTENNLFTIAESEDFNRGLLIIASKYKDLLSDVIRPFSMQCITNSTMMFTENDGHILVLLNI